MTAEEILYLEIKLQKLVTAREGMIAENRQREIQCVSLAYTEINFIEITEEMDKLLMEIK